MSQILDDIDVDASSLSRTDVSACIDEILVLNYPWDSVQFVSTVLIAPKVVQVQDVGLPRFPYHDTHAFDVWAGEEIRLKQI